MLCAYVTERGTEGPCQFRIDEQGRYYMLCDGPDDEDTHARWVFDAHTYLGPVLARCGHDLDEHEAPRHGRGLPDGSPEPWHCHGCCLYGAPEDRGEDAECFHAYTEVTA